MYTLELYARVQRAVQVDGLSERAAARHRPAKQRHSAKRIFERLRQGYGFAGGYTIVKDDVRPRKLSRRKMFVPWRIHPDTRKWTSARHWW